MQVLSHPPYQSTQKFYNQKLFTLQKENKHLTKIQYFYHPPTICLQKSISARHPTDLPIAAKQYENQRQTEITRFLQFASAKKETKQLHVTKNNGDLPLSVISLLCNSAPHLADLDIAANRRKTKDRPSSFHFCHFSITKKQQNVIFL